MKKITAYILVILFLTSLGSCAYKTCATYSFNNSPKKEHIEQTKKIETIKSQTQVKKARNKV